MLFKKVQGLIITIILLAYVFWALKIKITTKKKDNKI